MASSNPRWGYTRLRGALRNLCHEIGRNTIKRILKEHGLEPAPERCKKTSWKTFIKAHFGQIANISPQPHDALMQQVARNLTDVEDGFLKETRYLLCDRDPLYTSAFRSILRSGGVEVLRMPPKSPNLRPHAERFVRTIKQECLSRIVPLGEKHLRRAISDFEVHYLRERNHQGLGNMLIETSDASADDAGSVKCRERLGGLLKSYYREAA